MMLLLLFIGFQLDQIKLENQFDSARNMEELGMFDQAFELYQTLLISSEKLQLDSLQAEILIRSGTILGKSRNLEASESRFRTAESIGRKYYSPSITGRALLGIGNIKYFKNQPDSALIYYFNATPQLNEGGNSSDARGAMNNIAIILKDRANIEESIELLEDILTKSELKSDSSTIITFSRNLGLAFSSLKEFDRAKDGFEMSLKYAQHRLSIKDQIFALSGLADIATKKNLSKSALLYYTQMDSLLTIYLHQDYSDKILDLETKYRTAEIERDNAIKQAQIEVQNQRMIYLYVIAALLLLGIIGIYLFNEQRKKVIRALALQKDQENEKRINDLLNNQELKSAYAMLAGQEKAHKRIAEELHDNLGSILVTLNMFADSLQKKKDPQAQKELAGRISEIANQANETTRQISHSLHSGVLKHFGLEIAIKELIDALNESDAVTVESHVQITSKLDSDLSMNIYRIVQELVNNTLKHSKATKITLDLNQIKDHLSLIYSDNGVGFDQEQVVNGLGLKNLESRVDRLDGTISTESKPDQGTTTIIEVPVS